MGDPPPAIEVRCGALLAGRQEEPHVPHRRRAVLGLGAVALGIGARERRAGAELRTPPTLLRHAAPGDLYFTNAEGRQVYLAGIHTWPASQDRGPAFDWPGFLALQERIGGNLIRMWGIDGEDDHSVRGPTSPLPYARTADGRFDLTRFDDAFFARIRERAIEAGQRGMYVSQMLFNGWGLQFGEPRNPFDASPWKAGNNINGIDGDPRGTGKGTDVQTLRNPAITAIQERHVRRVVDALHDLPNLLFEVSNETANTDEAWAWQNRMLAVLKRHDGSRGHRHPIGMTSSAWGDDRAGIDARLARSEADWTSPGGKEYANDPPPASGARVSIVDTDHIWGIGGQSVDWVWRTFTRGHNVLSMDSLRGPDLAGRSVRYDADSPREQTAAAEAAAREGIRQTRAVSAMVDLRGMRSRGELSSTGHVLADPADGDFVVYAPEGGTFALDLSGLAAGKRLAARWVDVEAGTMIESAAVEGGKAAQFTTPFAARPAALVLRPEERTERQPPG
jgi:hypothetical protein